MEMRFTKCPACGGLVDVAAEKRSLKSLLCGEKQNARCGECGRLFLFQLRGQVIPDPSGGLRRDKLLLNP